MKWNWQHQEWPKVSFDASILERHEAEFLKQGGVLLGAFKHLKPAEETELLADTATSEALTTSAIEGEVLNRESVRSSILRHLGLPSASRQGNSREEGIARLMADLLRGRHDELTHERLWRWHEMLMDGRSSLATVGAYRTHPRPMQIVSGPEGRKVVHFEAPPSERVPQEMDAFLDWFNGSERDLPPIARAGIAHLYFESIHPFEDGNGRIGRAISEVALAQGLGDRSLAMLATEIESRQTEYYAALSSASRGLEATGWLTWFADVVLAGQRRTLKWIEFLIAKARLLDAVRGKVNQRQEKVLLRMFREGPSGFEGGLSAGNYQKITGASPATAGRDLAELVELGALRRTGKGKGTRYWLAVE